MGRSKKIVFVLASIVIIHTTAFWDDGTTTMGYPDEDEDIPRRSVFQWQKVTFGIFDFFGSGKKGDLEYRRRFSNCIAGISIDRKNLGTAIILNRRTLLSSANFLEPYVNRQKDVRVWALGRAGLWISPYRYRVWRWRRLIPKSLNAEHYHGPRGRHIPRHDLAIIHTWDTIYIYKSMPKRYHYAYRATLCEKNSTYLNATDMVYYGSGFENVMHIKENYIIRHMDLDPADIVNCERYLPKWWGKFVCVLNRNRVAGLQNGGGLFVDWKLMALGCFEIRYNEDRVLVFTDLRYYIDLVTVFANITHGEYYEYAYQVWGVKLGMVYDGKATYPFIPAKYPSADDMLPLGK